MAHKQRFVAKSSAGLIRRFSMQKQQPRCRDALARTPRCGAQQAKHHTHSVRPSSTAARTCSLDEMSWRDIGARFLSFFLTSKPHPTRRPRTHRAQIARNRRSTRIPWPHWAPQRLRCRARAPTSTRALKTQHARKLRFLEKSFFHRLTRRRARRATHHWKERAKVLRKTAKRVAAAS